MRPRPTLRPTRRRGPGRLQRTRKCFRWVVVARAHSAIATPIQIERASRDLFLVLGPPCLVHLPSLIVTPTSKRESTGCTQALGVAEAARELADAPVGPPAARKPRKVPTASLHTEKRRSSRVQGGKICYKVCYRF
jgi:hypothetical protein